jgi:hypothetical protein
LVIFLNVHIPLRQIFVRKPEDKSSPDAAAAVVGEAGVGAVAAVALAPFAVKPHLGQVRDSDVLKMLHA